MIHQLDTPEIRGFLIDRSANRKIPCVFGRRMWYSSPLKSCEIIEIDMGKVVTYDSIMCYFQHTRSCHEPPGWKLHRWCSQRSQPPWRVRDFPTVRDGPMPELFRRLQLGNVLSPVSIEIVGVFSMDAKNQKIR